MPITLVLDNARYQRCALVQSVADTLDIELLYLPAYSPHLHLIERLWKFGKKPCLYSKYSTDFSAFTLAMEDCFAPAILILAFPWIRDCSWRPTSLKVEFPLTSGDCDAPALKLRSSPGAFTSVNRWLTRRAPAQP